MSKQNFRKFRKNDWYEDEEYVVDKRSKKDKRSERRLARALRTKDFSEVIMQDMLLTSPTESEEQI